MKSEFLSKKEQHTLYARIAPIIRAQIAILQITLYSYTEIADILKIHKPNLSMFLQDRTPYIPQTLINRFIASKLFDKKSLKEFLINTKERKFIREIIRNVQH